MARRRAWFAGLVLAAAAFPASFAQSPTETLAINARPITEFKIGSDEHRFGPLTFIGGLEMVSRGRDFGSLSSFRFREPGGAFIGVADTGFWFFGTVARGDDGRPTGVEDFRMAEMVDASGTAIDLKWETDAEGLAVKGDIATVSFERAHRVSEFAINPNGMKAARRNLDFVIPKRELRQNKGIETIAYSPEDGPLGGARVVVSERSIDKAGNIFAAILEGPQKGVFTVARQGSFDITDGAFLPNGDLLLLERSFSMAAGVAMRLRRVEAAEIRPGAVADGQVLLTADMGYQIDNMEGLDVWRRADGALIVSLLSDDNHSILQRNLYLEFRLEE